MLAYTGPYPELFADFSAAEQRALLELYELLKQLKEPLLVVVGHLKGGVGKTTTTMYLAFLLGLFGEEVLVVDADPKNRQSMKWHTVAEGSPQHIQVKAWAGQMGPKSIDGREMVKLVRANRKPNQHLIVDTSPSFDEYLVAGLQLANIFLCMTSPRPMDTTELGKTVELAAQVETGKGSTIQLFVLLAQAKRGTNELSDAMAHIREIGVATFLDQDDEILLIGNSVQYSGSYCQVPTSFREYLPVFRELIEIQLDEQNAEDEDEAEAVAAL